MCGLVGMAGASIGIAEANGVFRDLLDVSQLRGRDATGVIRVHKSMDKYSWAKDVGPPAFLTDTVRYEDGIVQPAAAFIGHTRAKTIGENIRKNAHPFDFPDEGIVGVHNGTLRNHTLLSGYKTGMTDSHALYASIASVGAEQTFTDIDGAFACVWWDNTEGTLNFIRNKERTLYFAYSEDRKTMFWASEAWFFNAVARKGVKLWHNQHDQWAFPLEELQMVSCRIDLGYNAKDTFIWRKPVPIEPVPKRYGTTYTGNYAGGAGAANVASPFRPGDLDDDLSVIGGAPGWRKSANGRTFERDPNYNGGSGATPFPAATTPHQTAAQAAPAGAKGASQTGTNGSCGLNGGESSEKKRSTLMLPNRQAGFANSPTPSFMTASSKPSKPSETSSEPSSPASTSSSKLTQTGSSQPSTAGTGTKSPTNSQTSKPGSSSQQGNGVVTSLDSRRQSRSSLKDGTRPLVSHRIVAGIPFVTNNETGEETAFSVLLAGCEGQCSLCQFEFQVPAQIGLIISRNNVVCTECVNDNSNHHALFLQ